MNDLVAFLSLLVGVVIVIAILLLRLRAGEQVRSRLTYSEEEQEALAEVLTDPATGWLSGWLYLAGFRASRAATTFCLATFGLLAAGGIGIYRLHDSGVTDQLAALLAAIPGGVGNVMIPFAMASPWLILATVTAIPALFVRAMRRRRVASVDEDLPLVLDLLNTLAQAGIGFDAAIDRILDAQPSERPLAQELRSFQYDILAGRPRIESLRRLSLRLQVPTFSIFISAIIQAEQVGAGIAQTLRIQATEFRSRRRERAAAAAMSVPTKLIVPMVIGFLPGVFVALLGPMMHQAMEMMDRTVRGFSGG